MFSVVFAVRTNPNCSKGSIRLEYGASDREGTVFLCVDGVEGTVCDSYWNSRAADTTCRMLGFETFGLLRIMALTLHQKYRLCTCVCRSLIHSD